MSLFVEVSTSVCPCDEISIVDPREETPLLASLEDPISAIKMPSLRERMSGKLKDRKLLVDLCTLFFGVGAWIGVNSAFNELPLLVAGSPEGWSLPSYLTVIVQIANIGPITFSLLKKYTRLHDKYSIYLILVIGALSALLMAFLHQRTSVIFGTEHSTALFILMFTTALVGCTSSVLFMPYMGHFREIYLITYLIGEGLSGFIPSIVSLIQGVGATKCVNVTDQTGTHLVPETPPALFSSKIYFLAEFIILIISLLSFVFLNELTVSKSQLVRKSAENKAYKSEVLESNAPNLIQPTLSKKKFWGLCYFMGTVCLFANGVLPSIQSFSCLPYGNKVYHLTVSLSSMANPLACFLALFLPHTSFLVISTLTALFTIVGLYVFVMALLSPTPLLVGTLLGSTIVVIAWVLLLGLTSYTKLCVTSIFRREGGTATLFWCGAFSQMGSALGALIMFFVVNFGHAFKQYSPCDAPQ